MSRPRYYHGGQRGLRIGSRILPPTETRAAHPLADFGTVARGVARRDRVYVTTSPAAALMYAALHPSGGAVYEVEPQGPLTPDPDCDMPGLSWECASAVILTARKVRDGERRKVVRALLRDTTPAARG